VPKSLKKFWEMWVTPSYDPDFGVDISPFKVVVFPNRYGHLRPQSMPVIGFKTIFPLSLLDFLKKYSTRDDWDDMQLFCSKPFPAEEIDGIASSDQIQTNAWPIVLIPLTDGRDPMYSHHDS